MLMVLYGYDEQDAFAELRRVSQQHRVAMAELSVALVHLVCGPGEAGGNPADPARSDVKVRADVAVAEHWAPDLAPTPASGSVGRRLVENDLDTGSGRGAAHPVREHGGWGAHPGDSGWTEDAWSQRPHRGRAALGISGFGHSAVAAPFGESPF